MKRAWILLVLSCLSCSSVRQAEFYIEAVNTKEEQVPCVVFIDDEVVAGPDSKPVVTPAAVQVVFERGGAPLDKVKVAARAVKRSRDGSVDAECLRDAKASPYIEDARCVYPNDVRKQLFVLRRGSNFVE
jgi:hypothetical protein